MYGGIKVMPGIENERVEYVQKQIDKYDTNLLQHCMRTMQYVKRMQDIMNFRSDELLIAAKIHDVGKLFISSNIVNKPGTLSSVERNIIDLHSYFGYLYAQSLHFDELVSEIILFHHGLNRPRMDAIPYPTSDVVWLSDILRTCDVYDALASKRSYKPAFDKTTVFAIMEKEKLPTHMIQIMEQIAKETK